MKSYNIITYYCCGTNASPFLPPLLRQPIINISNLKKENKTMEFIRAFEIPETLAKRMSESERLRNKHSCRIPVVVDRADKRAPTLDKNKFLVPCPDTLASFMAVVRARLGEKIKESEALFVFIEPDKNKYRGRTLPSPMAMMSELYVEHKHEDGFLYLTYGLENTFGG
jgi:hypothetical protein